MYTLLENLSSEAIPPATNWALPKVWLKQSVQLGTGKCAVTHLRFAVQAWTAWSRDFFCICGLPELYAHASHVNQNTLIRPCDEQAHI